MARLTIAQLSSQLEQLRAHCAHLETERDSLRADLAATQRYAETLRSDISELQALYDDAKRSLDAAQPAQPAPAPTPAPTRSRYVASAAEQEAHDNYVRALMRAKEMAIRTGRSVRVGG